MAEAISIDLEEAFVDYNDVMNRIEEIIKIAIITVSDYAKNNSDVEFVIPPIPEHIPRYSYDELVEKRKREIYSLHDRREYYDNVLKRGWHSKGEYESAERMIKHYNDKIIEQIEKIGFPLSLNGICPT